MGAELILDNCIHKFSVRIKLFIINESAHLIIALLSHEHTLGSVPVGSGGEGAVDSIGDVGGVVPFGNGGEGAVDDIGGFGGVGGTGG